MRFVETPILGCFNIFPDERRDERGSFVKTLHKDLFIEHGLEHAFAEEYYSVSRQGVLRGLHFQLPPHQHAKLVYCIDGQVMDVVIDLRRDSPTYGQHAVFDLSAEEANILYIPQGLAHGFYTLSERATLIYKVTTVYAPESDAGILWNSAGIPWPDKNPLLSPRDRSFPMLADFDSPFSLLPEQVM